MGNQGFSSWLGCSWDELGDQRHGVQGVGERRAARAVTVWDLTAAPVAWRRRVRSCRNGIVLQSARGRIGTLLRKLLVASAGMRRARWNVYGSPEVPHSGGCELFCWRPRRDGMLSPLPRRSGEGRREGLRVTRLDECLTSRCRTSSWCRRNFPRRCSTTRTWDVLALDDPELCERMAATLGTYPRLENTIQRGSDLVAACDTCADATLVAFSSKTRGWCPSCAARRGHEEPAPYVSAPAGLRALRAPPSHRATPRAPRGGAPTALAADAPALEFPRPAPTRGAHAAVVAFPVSSVTARGRCRLKRSSAR